MAVKMDDRSRALISFSDSRMSKKACHIQRSCEFIASKIIISS